MATLKSINLKGTVIDIPQPTPYTLPTASSSVLGGVKIGNGISISSGVASVSAGTGISVSSGGVAVKPATTSTIGGVKPDGDTITIDSDGTIVATPTPYTLPTASSSVLGGVKIGNGISITNGAIDTNISFDSSTGTLTIK